MNLSSGSLVLTPFVAIAFCPSNPRTPSEPRFREGSGGARKSEFTRQSVTSESRLMETADAPMADAATERERRIEAATRGRRGAVRDHAEIDQVRGAAITAAAAEAALPPQDSSTTEHAHSKQCVCECGYLMCGHHPHGVAPPELRPSHPDFCDLSNMRREKALLRAMHKTVDNDSIAAVERDARELSQDVLSSSLSRLIS